jgi:hypothetical protein
MVLEQRLNLGGLASADFAEKQPGGFQVWVHDGDEAPNRCQAIGAGEQRLFGFILTHIGRQRGARRGLDVGGVADNEVKWTWPPKVPRPLISS